MTKNTAKDIIFQQVQDMVLEQLEAGVVPWKQGWVSLEQQGIKGNPYRGTNALITSMRAFKNGYSDPRWITMNNLKERGGRVKEAELKNATNVVFWSAKTKSTSTGEDTDPEVKKFWFCSYYRVWNVQQCEGLELKPILKQTIDTHAESDLLTTKYLSAQNIPVTEHDSRACYVPKEDKIGMPVRDSFKTTEEYYATLFHEIAHSTGHPTRLNRFEKDRELAPFGSADYGKEELVAELSAAFLCRHVALDTKVLTNQAAYIGNWIEKIKADKSLVPSAAQKAQAVFNYIVGEHSEE